MAAAILIIDGHDEGMMMNCTAPHVKPWRSVLETSVSFFFSFFFFALEQT